MASWSNKPEQRCELSVVYHVFSTSSITNEPAHCERPGAEESAPGPGSPQDTRDAERGNLATRNDRDLTMAKKTQRGTLPRIISPKPWSPQDTRDAERGNFATRNDRDLTTAKKTQRRTFLSRVISPKPGSPPDTRDAERGNLATRNDRDLTTAKKTQRGTFLSRVISLFKPTRSSGPKIQSHVDEMDKARPSTSHPLHHSSGPKIQRHVDEMDKARLSTSYPLPHS